MAFASIVVELQTRNTFQLQLEPVTRSVWPPETMCRTFFSLVTCAIAIAMPEFTSPIMKLTWSRSISFRVFCTPVPTSLAESSTRSSIGRPRMPPFWLISSTANFAPTNLVLCDRGINSGQRIDHSDPDGRFAAHPDDEGGRELNCSDSGAHFQNGTPIDQPWPSRDAHVVLPDKV